MPIPGPWWAPIAIYFAKKLIDELFTNADED